MEEPDFQEENKVIERPKALKILCILTFIWSGLNLFFSIITYSFFDQLKPLVSQAAESYKIPEFKFMLDIPPLFFMVSALIYAGSLFGAYRMFQQRRNGFHYYTISQILLILSQMFFFKMSSPSYPELLISAVFVILYSRNLKFMH